MNKVLEPYRKDLVYTIAGHVGDGNFHLSLLVDMSDADEVRRAGVLMERVVELALAMLPARRAA